VVDRLRASGISGSCDARPCAGGITGGIACLNAGGCDGGGGMNCDVPGAGGIIPGGGGGGGA